MVLLDLDELESARSTACPCGRRRRWAPVRFRRPTTSTARDRPLARGPRRPRRGAPRPAADRAGPHAHPPAHLGLAVQPHHRLLVLRARRGHPRPRGARGHQHAVEASGTGTSSSAEQVVGSGRGVPQGPARVAVPRPWTLDYRFSFNAPGPADRRPRSPPGPSASRSCDRGRKVFDADLWLTRTELTARAAVRACWCAARSDDPGLARHPPRTPPACGSRASPWCPTRTVQGHRRGTRTREGDHDRHPPPTGSARVLPTRRPTVHRPPPPDPTAHRPVLASIRSAGTDLIDAGAAAAHLAAAGGPPTGPPAPVLWRLLGRADSGRIEITEDGGAHRRLRPGPARPLRPAGHRRARHGPRPPHLPGRAARAAAPALGEAYLRGWWDVDDLTGFLRLLSREVHRYDPARNGVARTAGAVVDRLPGPPHAGQAPGPGQHPGPLRPGQRLLLAHARRDDDVQLGRVRPRRTRPWPRPRRHKLDRLCRRLDLGPDDHVVEIGTGWGGFAVHAAATYGCRVTTTTISRAQFAYATDRVAEAGLADLRRGAPRRLPRPHRHLRQARVDRDDRGGRLARARHLLRRLPAAAAPRRAHGPAGHRDPRASATSGPRTPRTSSRRSSSPAAACPRSRPSPARSRRVTDLTLTDVDDYGLHYAETLRRWRANLHAHAGELDRLGLDDTFRRMWDFYLAYCEAAFDERRDQRGAVRPGPPRPDGTAAGVTSDSPHPFWRRSGRPRPTSSTPEPGEARGRPVR